MATSGDGTFSAGIVCISRENRDELHLVFELLVIAVVVAKRLESSSATCWF